MYKLINLVGKKFGRLTVISKAGIKYKRRVWVCRCDCGTEKEIVGVNLRKGNTTSCGCFQRECISKVIKENFKHGKARSVEYSAWNAMHKRCTRDNHPSFEHYGGRGIKVCDRWLDFECFLEDMGKRPEGLSLDRVNNNGNYEPSNCRWTTRKEQANNRSNNRKINCYDDVITIAEFSEKFKIKRGSILYRQSLGWESKRIIEYYR